MGRPGFWRETIRTHEWATLGSKGQAPFFLVSLKEDTKQLPVGLRLIEPLGTYMSSQASLLPGFRACVHPPNTNLLPLACFLWKAEDVLWCSMVDTPSYKRMHWVNWRSQPLYRRIILLTPKTFRSSRDKSHALPTQKVLVPAEDHRLRALGAEVEFLE